MGIRAFCCYAVLVLISLLMVYTREEAPPACSTDEELNELLGRSYTPRIRQYRQLLLRIQRRPFQLSNSAQVPRQLVVPVVVHVVHDGGSSNISDDQVRDAIRLLNEIYQARHPDLDQVIPYFKSRIGNPNIKFRLARLDPEGNCTTGITRHYSELTHAADDKVKKLPDAYWADDRYLNIWVVESVSGGSSGYAYLPCLAATLEGVVIRNRYFGSIGTTPNQQSRRYALAHEVGHYLGLRHTYGYSNRSGPGYGNCDDDDDIHDTPLTEGAIVGTCDLYQHACPGSTDLFANVQNIMDYSGGCRSMFTTGQTAVMRQGLDGGFTCRSLLVSDDNQLFTGVSEGQRLPACQPVAWLVASGPRANQAAQSLTAGDSLTFHGDAYNIGADSTLAFYWHFAGGQPENSIQRDPVVTYHYPGIFDVFLRVENAVGSDTLLRKGYVHVHEDLTPPDSVAAPASRVGSDTAIWR